MIKINDNRKISEIQEDFSKTFPFLKVIFYTVSDGINSGTEKYLQIKNTSKKIGEYRMSCGKGINVIYPDQTVFDIEKFFKAQYNLMVYVFRKSGKAWLETSATGNWSLEKQNSEGELLSTPYKENY